MSERAELLLIYTGGTIGMVEDAETGALHPINFDQLQVEIPELKKLDCNISVESLVTPIDSSNMNIQVWEELLEILESNYDSYDLDDLMYSDVELESEIGLIQKSISKHLCVKEV